MTTLIEKEFDIDQPINMVWKSLSDPADVVTCVPGASITDKLDEQNYKGEVVAKFGPIKAVYNGDIEIVELDEQEHKMVLKGKGLDSKGKGSADMEMVGLLTDNGGSTHVSFKMNITIVGMLAQFGSRLINDVSNQLINQFVTNFRNKLAAAAPPVEASAPVAEPASVAAENGGDAVQVVEAKPATKVAEEPAKQADNALDASSLMGTVLKSIFGGIADFFKSLFGGKKA